MDHLADSTIKFCQGGKGRYVGSEDIPMDNSSGEECEPVIVFDGSFKHQKYIKKMDGEKTYACLDLNLVALKLQKTCNM